MCRRHDGMSDSNGSVSFLRFVALIVLLAAASILLTACAPKMTNPISDNDDMAIESDTAAKVDDNNGKLKHYPVVL